MIFRADAFRVICHIFTLIYFAISLGFGRRRVIISDDNTGIWHTAVKLEISRYYHLLPRRHWYAGHLYAPGHAHWRGHQRRWSLTQALLISHYLLRAYFTLWCRAHIYGFSSLEFYIAAAAIMPRSAARRSLRAEPMQFHFLRELCWRRRFLHWCDAKDIEVITPCHGYGRERTYFWWEMTEKLLTGCEVI